MTPPALLMSATAFSAPRCQLRAELGEIAGDRTGHADRDVLGPWPVVTLNAVASAAAASNGNVTVFAFKTSP